MQALKSTAITPPKAPTVRQSARPMAPAVASTQAPIFHPGASALIEQRPIINRNRQRAARNGVLLESIKNIQSFLDKNRSPIILTYQVFGCWMAFYYVQPLMGRVTSITTPFIACAFILGIYLLNWLSEIKADFMNDESRLVVLRNNTFYWLLTVASLLLGVLVPTAMGKLHWSIPLLLVVGILYSFRLIPWRDAKAKSWRSVRLKDIPVVKSLTITSCYTAYLFGMPILFSAVTGAMDPMIPWLIVGFALTNFMNTTYDDFLDLQADRLEGVPTVPVMLGAEKFLAGFAGTIAVWIAIIVAAWSFQMLDNKHAFLLLAQTLLPAAWMVFHKLFPSRRFTLDFLIETDCLLSAAGFYWLSLR